jgi:hypothetical protein
MYCNYYIQHEYAYINKINVNLFKQMSLIYLSFTRIQFALFKILVYYYYISITIILYYYISLLSNSLIQFDYLLLV